MYSSGHVPSGRVVVDENGARVTRTTHSVHVLLLLLVMMQIGCIGHP